LYTPTSWGGASTIQALNLLELADLRQYGGYTTSPQSLFWLMEISACQSLTRDLPPETRISKKSASDIWLQMQKRTWRGLPANMRAFVGWGAGQVEGNACEPAMLDGLKKIGLKVEVISPKEAGRTRGYWAGAWIDPVSRHIKGGVTPGMEGGVVAY